MYEVASRRNVALQFGFSATPQGQDIVERSHKDLVRHIKSLLGHRFDWYNFLEAATTNFYNTYSTVTHWKLCDLWNELTPKRRESLGDLKKDIGAEIVRIQQIIQQVKKNIIKRGVTRNKNKRPTNIEPGQMVLVKRPDTVSNKFNEERFARKALALKNNNNNTYTIRWLETGGWKKSEIPNSITEGVHISQLKRYKTGDDEKLSMMNESIYLDEEQSWSVESSDNTGSLTDNFQPAKENSLNDVELNEMAFPCLLRLTMTCNFVRILLMNMNLRYSVTKVKLTNLWKPVKWEKSTKEAMMETKAIKITKI